MKVTEDTPDRFTITCRRPILADLLLVVFVVIGLAFTFGVARGDITPLTPALVIFGLGFAGLGGWGLTYNARATVTLTASTRRVSFHWRKLLGTETAELSLADLRKVRVHEDDDMHTLEFTFANADPILLEKAYTTNRGAYALAQRLIRWLETTGWTSDAT